MKKKQVKKNKLKLDENLVRARTLLKIGTLLSRAYTRNEVAEIIVNETFPIIGALNGDVMLLRNDKTFDVLSHKGYPQDFLRQFPIIPQDTPLLTHHVMETRSPHFISEIETIPKKYTVAKAYNAASGSRSSVLLPLLIKKNVIGVVQFTFKERRIFHREEKIFMNTIANQCSQAFERVFALEELQASKKQLEVILTNITAGIVALNQGGKIIYTNTLGTRLLGYTSDKNLKQQTLSEVLKKFKIIDSKHTVYDDLPYTIKRFGKFELKFINKKTQEYRWYNVKISLLRDKEENTPFKIITFQDITEIKEIDQKKDDFINIASHELKTPLTSMRLYLELLKRQLSDTENKALRYVDSIGEQIYRLQKLITDLLNVSQLQQEKLKFNKEYFSLDTFIEGVIDELQLSTPTHIFTLTSAQNIPVFADKLRIYQVINNLLSNAVKFSPLEKHIDILIEKGDTFVQVKVRDSGSGISKEHHKKIFDRFYQVGGRDKNKHHSLGMGLYIVKEIIRNHRGDVWVESAPRKGSTFNFTLPLAETK